MNQMEVTLTSYTEVSRVNSSTTAGSFLRPSLILALSSLPGSFSLFFFRFSIRTDGQTDASFSAQCFFALLFFFLMTVTRRCNTFLNPY